MHDARGGADGLRASRCVERRAPVSDELLCQRDSLWRQCGCLLKALGKQLKFVRGFADGAACEWDGSAPTRRPMCVPDDGLERAR